MTLSQYFRAAVCMVIAGSVISVDDVRSADPPLIVRDVNVGYVSRGMSNDRSAFRSTLPAVLLSQRPSPPKPSDGVPQPLGIITFEGTPSDDVDVLLEYDNSTRIMARWPHTEMRSTRTLWQKMKLVASSTPPSTPFPATSWLNPLRNADRLSIEFDRRTEKFLLYDMAVKSPTTIELEATETGYKARNLGATVSHDFTVYRPTGNGKYRAAYAKEVPGLTKDSSKPTKAASTEATKPAAAKQPQQGVVAQAFEGLAVAIAGQPPKPGNKNAPAEGQPAPAPPNSPQHDITWSGPEKSVDELLAEWKPLLSAQGLGDAEIAHVQSILKERAFDKDSARVVYRLDQAAIDKLVPLEVSPQPDKVARVWLVIYDGADPEIKTRIAKLIAQLGDASYDKRMEAKAELLKLGPTAVPQLNAEKSNKDAEIAFRVDEILEEVQNPSDPNANQQIGIEVIEN